MKVILIFLLVVANGCHSQQVQKDANSVFHGDMVLSVYLVRHAESKKNVAHLPWTPEEELDTLTVKGRRQAAAIGRFLKDKGIVAVLSSPADRARETAQAISQVIGLKRGYEVEKAFASLRPGKDRDGNQMSWAWREKQWAQGQDPRPEGGESLLDGEIRAKNALNRLSERFYGMAVVIVSHGDICAALLGHAENAPMSKRYVLHNVPTGSVSELIMTDTGWHVLEEGRQPFE